MPCRQEGAKGLKTKSQEILGLLGKKVLFMSPLILAGVFVCGCQPSPSDVQERSQPVSSTAASNQVSTKPDPVAIARAQHEAALKAKREAVKARRDAILARQQAIEEKREADREARREQAQEEANAAQQSADDDAHARIKAKVERDYPGDYISQKGVYDMAVSAYEYMKTADDQEIKGKVVSDYPDDYVSQKGVYDMAVSAKSYMETVQDQDLKEKVEQDYPHDYVSQKGVYDMQIKAKGDMAH